MTCIVCKAEQVELEQVAFKLEENITVTVEAPLCKLCLDKLPGQVKDAIRNPMLRAALKVAGVSLGVFK